MTSSEAREILMNGEGEATFGEATVERFVALVYEALPDKHKPADEQRPIAEQLTNDDLDRIAAQAVTETRPDLLSHRHHGEAAPASFPSGSGRVLRVPGSTRS